jgi:hypothetical protein
VIFPRFSIRSLIVLTFVAALCAYSIAAATQNQEWAVAVAVTIGSVVVCLVSFGLLFTASWAFGSILSVAFAPPRSARPTASGPFANNAQGGGQLNSPFASPERLPPQVIPDQEVPQD